MNLSQQILETVAAAGRRGMSPAELKKRLSAPRDEVAGAFRKLVKKGELVEMPGGRFRRAERIHGRNSGGRRSTARTPEQTRRSRKGAREQGAPQEEARGPGGGSDAAEAAELPEGAVKGNISVHRNGFGFVTVEDGSLDGDVFIPPGYLGGALSGDRVACTVVTSERDGRHKGEVLAVLDRARTHLTGYLERASKKRWILMPTNPDLSSAEMHLRPQDIGDAEPGQVVLARVTDYGDGDGPMRGVVEEVLGSAGDPAIDTRMIIAEHALRTEWPEEVLAAAEEVPREVDAEEARERLDLRDQPCYTIDGADARDLDDAVFVEPGEGKGKSRGYRLWVHIADVSHYVRPGDPIDREARERGTSTYLPDRVIPMLPTALSNGICSLNPEVDRMALTCRIDFDARGRPTGSKVLSTVIRSHARLTYQDVQQACVERDPSTCGRLGEQMATLDLAFELAGKLRERRREEGSLDFDLPSVKVVVDDAGRPVGIQELGDLEAHGLIEMFMVAANEAVSRWMVEAEKDFAFRIHETPDPQKLTGLADLARDLGFDPGKLIGTDPRPALAELLEQVDGKPEERLIRTLTLRCMKLAEYSSENKGHFGLGSKAYTHFTSPIRRYPDLIVHRLLKHRSGALRLSKAEHRELTDALPEILAKLSFLERKAEDAERDAVKLKKIHFLSSKEGEVFHGIVSGVKEFGIFVELTEILADGVVHVSKLGSDYWNFDEAGRRMVGSSCGFEYRLGDPIEVVLESADPMERAVVLRPASDPAAVDPEKPRRRSRRKGSGSDETRGSSSRSKEGSSERGGSRGSSSRSKKGSSKRGRSRKSSSKSKQGTSKGGGSQESSSKSQQGSSKRGGSQKSSSKSKQGSSKRGGSQKGSSKSKQGSTKRSGSQKSSSKSQQGSSKGGRSRRRRTRKGS